MLDGQKTIKDLFDGSRIFNIPKYQRAYAWEENQLDAFIEDLENQDTNKDHFFGTILLQKLQTQTQDGEFTTIDIVDGQQRITTIIIFMKLLLIQQEDRGIDVTRLKRIYIQDIDTYKLRVLDIDNDFFESYILNDPKSGYNEAETPSQRRLLKAKERLGKWIEEHPDKTKNFIEKIGSMKVLTYSVEDRSEAALMFETTNNRGKSLTSLEKAKSLLMHKTYLASGNPETGLDRLQKRFSIIYREYEKIEETRKIRGESGKTAEDMILQYHFIAFENWKDKDYTDSVRMINQQINEQIKARRLKDTEVFIDRYSRELKESFGIMKRLLRSRDSCLLDIFALNRPAAFYPLLIKTYKFDRPNRRPNFEKIKRLIEIICFRFGIIGSRSDKGVSQLYVLARDFVQNSDQRQFNLESKFNKLIDDLKEFINKYCDDALFTDRLRARGFYEDVDRSDQRYLFWKYENYLREKSGYPEMMSHDEFITTNPRAKLSMEHIIPQNPEKSKVVVDNSILSITNFESQEFKENFLHSIGNLTIDPLATNSSKSNQNFENKDQKYFRRAPLMTQNELSDFLNKETRQWDETSITNRADKIVKFALEHWDHQKV